jgi:hypothetical protein
LWAALALAAANPARANLVQNGSFSSGTFDNWTVTGDITVTTDYAVFNAGDLPPNGVLSQVINTTAGESYALTFQYSWGSYNGTGQSITASALDGLTVLATALDSPPYVDAYTSGGWQPFELDFTASSSTTTINFADYAGNNTISSDSALTGIDVSAPEPASLTLLALGAGATIVRRSRRKIVQPSKG